VERSITHQDGKSSIAIQKGKQIAIWLPHKALFKFTRRSARLGGCGGTRGVRARLRKTP
jgi:hypothetical protein